MTAPMTREELLACPFCGGEAEICGLPPNRAPECWIRCAQCHASSGGTGALTEHLIAGWNTRHGVAQQPPSKEHLFCHWLKGYLTVIEGRDELTAFEANTIRNTLNELISSAEPACGDCSQASQHHNGDLQPGSAEAHTVSSTTPVAETCPVCGNSPPTGLCSVVPSKDRGAV